MGKSNSNRTVMARMSRPAQASVRRDGAAVWEVVQPGILLSRYWVTQFWCKHHSP